MRRRLLLSTLLLLCATSVRTVTAQNGEATLSVVGRTNANPSIAAIGSFVAVTWSAATTNAMDIFVATSRDGGRSFSAPVQVNNVAGDARVSGEQPPRVALVPTKGREPAIVVVWTAKSGANWRLLSTRSNNGGHSFDAATAVPGSVADGARGWESIAVDSQGRVSVLWLDHRDLVAAGTPMTHAMPNGATSSSNASAPATAKADPTARASLSQLMFSSLGSSTASAVSITRSVCYCCKTSLVISGSDTYAVWRHVYPGSVRDMAFTVSRDRGRTWAPPLRISEDHWQIDGCPDNGPAIAIDRRQQAHVVWPTSPDGKDASSLAIFYAKMVDGTAFTSRVKLPTHGPAGHPQIVIGNDGVPIVTWDEIVEGIRRIALARVKSDAAGVVTFQSLVPPAGSLGAWYPVLATASTGTFVAWVQQAEKGSTIGVALVK